MEPEHIVAVSMLSLLGIGSVAQMMQQRGGATARAAPYVATVGLIAMALFAVTAMQTILDDRVEWREAERSWQGQGQTEQRAAVR